MDIEPGRRASASIQTGMLFVGLCIFMLMKQTEYFKRRVLQQRPYIQLDWCEQAVRHPDHTEVQADGRIRHWLFVPELGKFLRVITLSDGETLHNAFPDRSFNQP
jgi:hypothetical protein